MRELIIVEALSHLFESSQQTHYMAITTSRSLLSVVVPAYNEEEVLPVFHERLTAVLGSLDIDGEIVYVNDGSSDKTMEVLQSIQRRPAGSHR